MLPKKIYHLVMGDAVKPRREGRPLPLKPFHGLYHLEEHLLGNILSVRRVSQFEVNVPVYAVEVTLIKPASSVATLAARC